MKNTKLTVLAALIVVITSCSSGSDADLYQNSRDNIVDIRTQINAINTDDILLSGSIVPYVIGEYIAVKDYKSPDNQIFIFDSQHYSYITSTGKFGQGPGEITSMGDLMWNDNNREMYVPDFATYKVYAFNMDSVVANSAYMPYEKARMRSDMFPSNVTYINDTLSFGRIIKPTSESTFDVYTGRWNLLTGEVKTQSYRYPRLSKYRYMVSASLEQNTVIEANMLYDLLTILDIDGNLRTNVHGPNWSERADGKRHFVDVQMYDRYIIASYDGHPSSENVKPTILQVFDVNGNYVKTLDAGYSISHFCIDERTGRLILSLDDDIQLAYVNLDDILI